MIYHYYYYITVKYELLNDTESCYEHQQHAVFENNNFNLQWEGTELTDHTCL